MKKTLILSAACVAFASTAVMADSHGKKVSKAVEKHMGAENMPMGDASHMGDMKPENMPMGDAAAKPAEVVEPAPAAEVVAPAVEAEKKAETKAKK